jgi:ABC-type antimicrobial peptide transport system permease subunit
MLTRFVGGFSLIALVLAAIGVYGVISCAVRLRTREFGIRMALGAGRTDVLRHTFAGVVQPIGFGVAAGMLASVALGRFAESLLYGLSPRDPLFLAGIALAMVAVSVVAALVPARRALRTDPRNALSS